MSNTPSANFATATALVVLFAIVVVGSGSLFAFVLHSVN